MPSLILLDNDSIAEALGVTRDHIKIIPPAMPVARIPHEIADLNRFSSIITDGLKVRDFHVFSEQQVLSNIYYHSLHDVSYNIRSGLIKQIHDQFQAQAQAQTQTTLLQDARNISSRPSQYTIPTPTLSFSSITFIIPWDVSTPMRRAVTCATCKQFITADHFVSQPDASHATSNLYANTVLGMCGMSQLYYMCILFPVRFLLASGRWVLM